MLKKALLIIDIQNDITKNYKDIIDNINKSIDWAVNNDIHVIYIRHEYLSETMRKFKPNTFGSELVTDLKMVSSNIFTKNIGSACSSEHFMKFIKKEEIGEFYLTGADAIACVKATNNGLLKENYIVNIVSDCITSYDKKRIKEMLDYYKNKGSKIVSLRMLGEI